MAVKWHNGFRQGEDGMWYYRFVLKGVLHQGNTGCPIWKDARDWVNAYKGRLSKGEVGLKQAPIVRLAYQAWVQSREGKVSPSHLKRASQAIEQHILPHIGNRPADQVTTEDVELLLSYCHSGGARRGQRQPLQGGEITRRAKELGGSAGATFGQRVTDGLASA